MSAITIENLTVRFANKIILQSFNAEIQPGEFIGIFGPNGAGKSTFLRSILGLNKFTEGKITILGRPCQRGNSAIGYLSQFRASTGVHRLSGRSYLSAVYEGYRWGLPFGSRAKTSHLQSLIELTHTQDFIDRPYLQLSGGERQRIALAQALLGYPKILLLDEPLSGLDPAQQEHMVKLIQSIQQKLKIAVLFTAHDINPLLGVMDRVLYLTEGKAAIGSVDEVVNSEKLSWLYNAPIMVLKQDNYLFVVHKNMGSNIHAHDHPFC